ncbi:MAG TPA: 8-oxo-dGTP diphosphatase [Polyangiaceae bacterium]|jgi:8-oxo-dGTP diphosphatase|nr:8-oxo-dGTP diphosphatase [Polyangiaceae bacterium]
MKDSSVAGAAPRRLADIDWSNWQPRDVATLLFIQDAGRVLLIRKKRGLGAGKINGPGGRLEPDETPEQAAIREVEEEVCVTPLGVSARGTLSFEFTDGYRLHAHLFVASGFRGTPRETDEAIPIWFALDSLPFHEMWADDALWLPHVLAGRSVVGRFVFEGDAMLDHELACDSGAS